MCYSSWGRKELDTTERLHFHFFHRRTYLLLTFYKILKDISFSWKSYYIIYIMQNARQDEAQAEIKIAGRNINNFRYAEDTTLMGENKEELKSLLMKVKEESEKAS